MEFSVATIFFLTVAFAVGAAVILLMIGKWLDISGLRYKMDTQRNALNLLQLIVSSSPIVQEDPSGEPKKLILDKDKLEKYEIIDLYGEPNSPPYPYVDPLRDEWLSCCDFLSYDQKLTITDLVTNEVWAIGDISIKTESKCYPKRTIGYTDMPVVIFNGTNYNHGVANLTLQKTPLSEFSFWLSQAFIRASWDGYWGMVNESYNVTIPLDTDNIELVEIRDDRVCMKLRPPTSKITCKPFVRTGASMTIVPVSPGAGCFHAVIGAVDRNKVYVKYPA